MIQSKLMILPPGWYAILFSSEVSNKKPKSIKRFGLDLVVWRTKSGDVIVQEDRCPHRAAKLSLGRLVDDTLECPFHGFRFNGKGECTFVPELNKSAPNLCVKKFMVEEKHGLIWINWREDANVQKTPPWFEQKTDQLYTHQYSETWNVHFTRSVENQLDFAHLSFVHKTSIGRFSKVGQTPHFELNAEQIKFHFGRAESGRIEFLFPNIWMNLLNPKYMITLAFAPIDEQHTKLYLQVHRAYVTLPPFSWIMNFFERLLNKWILSQDRAVVESQGVENGLDANDVLFPSDKAIRHFREWVKRSTKI